MTSVERANDDSVTGNQDPAEADAQAGRAGGRWQLAGGASRRTVVLGLAALVGAMTIAGASGVGVSWMLLVSSALVSVALAPGSPAGSNRQGAAPVSVAALLPLGFLVLTFVAVIWLQFAHWVPSVVPGPRVVLAVGWAAINVSFVAVGWARGGRVNLLRGDGPTALAFGVVWGIGVMAAVLHPFTVWTRNVAGGTDFNRHLQMMKAIATSGSLDYGTDSYPRGIHSVVAMAWGTAGGADYLDGWMALQSVLWLQVALIGAGLVTVGHRVAVTLGVRHWLAVYVVPALVAVVFLQSMWITAMVRLGFLTSIFLGLLLVAALIFAIKSGVRLGPASVGFFAVVSSLAAHSWTLVLPVFLVALAVSCVWLWRERKHYGRRSILLSLGLVLVALLSAIDPVFSLIRVRTQDGELTSDLSAAGTSGLDWPGLPWLAGTGLAIFVIVKIWRSNLRAFALIWASMCAVGVLLSVGLLLTTELTKGAPGYYASKTMWALSALVLPLAAAGAAWLANAILSFAHARQVRLARIALLSLLIGCSVVVMAGVVGRLVGSPSKALMGITYGLAGIPIQIPIVTELEKRGVQTPEDGSVLVWGVLPYAEPVDLMYSAGFFDLFARESTAWIGTRALKPNYLARAVFGRKAEQACEYLREHPDALRITGPYPEAGAPWLIDSGCPAGIVQPDRWVSVPIDDAWFEDTAQRGLPYFYPSYDEFQAYLAEQQAKRNQSTPPPSQS